MTTWSRGSLEAQPASAAGQGLEVALLVPADLATEVVDDGGVLPGQDSQSLKAAVEHDPVAGLVAVLVQEPDSPPPLRLREPDLAEHLRHMPLHGRLVDAGELGQQQRDVRLDQGDFVRKLVGVKFAYFFTPRVFFQSLTQYNNQQQVFTANLRFAWLNTAGTGLFVVFNDGEQADGLTRWQAPIARSLTVKYTRQLGTGG